jgi:hypothetical protein
LIGQKARSVYDGDDQHGAMIRSINHAIVSYEYLPDDVLIPFRNDANFQRILRQRSRRVDEALTIAEA